MNFNFLRYFCITTLVISANAYSDNSTNNESCPIERGGHSAEPNQIYPSHHACGSCSGQQQYYSFCQLFNQLMMPDFTSDSDIVPIPHRGTWGTKINTGLPSENTLGALWNSVLDNDFKIIEIDISLTGEGLANEPTAILGHYFSMLAFGGDPDKAPKDYSPEQIQQFRMRNRAQQKTNNAFAHIPLLEDAIIWAKNNNVILTVDPKMPTGAPDDELQRLMAITLNLADEHDALKNIILKAVDPYDFCVLKMDQYLDKPFSDYEGKFLWIPVVGTHASDPISTVLQSIDNWNQKTSASRHVAFYEAQLYAPSNPAANPFNHLGDTYENMIDYVKSLGIHAPKRAGLWSVDPMNPRGTLGREYNFKFIGNTDDDKRGNVITTLSYKYGPHCAITTDRPNVFKELAH